MNTSYLSLDEHMVVYWVDQCCNGVVVRGIKDISGTRMEIETKLLEFLYCLKYYSSRWLRAKFYAEMVGVLHC